MKTHSQDFLEALASLPSDTFESRFSRLALKLNLGSVLDRNELTLLYEAAFCASLCNHALNDVDPGRHEIQLEQETHRRNLEEEFMVARDVLLASPGRQTLPDAERELIEEQFLRVFVREEKLAW